MIDSKSTNVCAKHLLLNMYSEKPVFRLILTKLRQLQEKKSPQKLSRKKNYSLIRKKLQHNEVYFIPRRSLIL